MQAACVKTEPGETGESKPNLRRRMGSFVVKPEPGQNQNGYTHNTDSMSGNTYNLILKLSFFYSVWPNINIYE